MPEIIEQYVETGKARLVYREFPLTSIHPAAQKASEAAVCAGQQGRYWEMNEKLFATQQAWSAATDPVQSFGAYAAELGLDVEAFSACLNNGEAALHVEGDVMAGESLGVSATPYFFINEMPVRGGLPVETFGMVIDYVAAGGQTPEIVPRGDDWHRLGNTQTARAITVAFIDYADTQSRQHVMDVLPKLKESYVDTGQMLYVVHPWSSGKDTPSAAAAATAECAGQQGKFWEMHARLFEEQETWTQASDTASLFSDYAADLGLETAQFEECVGSQWAALRVQAGNVVGALYGVPRAPVFLFNNGDGKEGSPTFDEFKSIIDSIVNQ